MKFHKTTEYAFRIMGYMASGEKALYTTEEIYHTLQIPRRYLRKLMVTLGKKELITGTRGKNGGYILRKNPEEITLLDIAEAMNDEIFTHTCFFGFEQCRLSETPCIMHKKWEDIKSSIEKVLRETSLSDLKKENTQKYIVGNTINIHSLNSLLW